MPTDAQIKSFVEQNINNPKAIADAMIANNLSISDLSKATGNSSLTIEEYFRKAGLGPTGHGQISDAAINLAAQDFLKAGGNPADVKDAMERNNLTVEDIARATNSSVASVNAYLNPAPTVTNTPNSYGTGVDDRGFSLLAPGFWNGGQTTGWTGDPTQGSQTYSGDTAGLYQYYKDLGYTLAPDGTVTTPPRASMNEYDFPTGDVVQLRLANGNAGGFDPQGNIIDLGRKYEEGQDIAGQIAMMAVMLGMGGIVGAHAGLLGSESLSTLGGSIGTDTLASSSEWWSNLASEFGGTAATGAGEIGTLANAAVAGGGSTVGLGGYTAEQWTAMLVDGMEAGATQAELLNAMTATYGVPAAAATALLSSAVTTMGGPLSTTLTPNTITPNTPPVTPNTPVVPPVTPNTTPTPSLPNNIFNPGQGSNIPNLENLIAGGVDFGSSMYVADKYKEIFDQLLEKSDPFGGERSKYFPIVQSAVDNAAQYNGLAFRGLNDPNFWTEQSWLKGIGDYSANETQKKLASQGYNYSGNTQEKVAKTLRDTMAQYVIPGQQNLISGANMAGNLVNTAGSLAGAQFNPAQAMGPLSSIATSGLNSFQNGIGSLFNNNGQAGQSLVGQGLNWVTNQLGNASVMNDVYGQGGTFTSNGGWGTGNDWGNQDLGQFF